MGALANKLNPASAPTTNTDGQARTTTITGPHDDSSYEGILSSCREPVTVKFAAPPSVYRKFKDDGSLAFTTYRYKLAPKPDQRDLEQLIARAAKAPAHQPDQSTGAHWFVFQAGDLQIGKRSRDGSTEQIVERYLESVDAAVQEFKDLKRHGIEGVQICFPGDCIEGIVSQGGKNQWLTEDTITEQFRILRRLMLHTVEAFAPLTDRVFMDTVNGNHDQAQRQLNTYPGDGWATESALAVKDALLLNRLAFGHVEVRVPDKWAGSMTVPVGSTLVTVAHGHQWSRGKGIDWLCKQDFGRQDARGAQVLQHGHEHEWSVGSTRDVMRVCSPTYDCGSDWFRERAGGDGRRGGLAYLLRAGEVSRMSLV